MIQDGPSSRGIVPDFGALEGRQFDASAVARGVRDFYERTAAYELDAWAAEAKPRGD